MSPRRYPKIHIRSKNELARHISGVKMSRANALKLINDSIDNFDSYWMDHPTYSKPKDNKWVRDASQSNLGKLLKRIDAKVLKPHDRELPNFIFGGVSRLNHKAAVVHLLGKRRKRVLLKLDISRFFEQNKYDRVQNLFQYKFDCGFKGSQLLADLCCVPFGAKDNPSNYKTIARGFPTSPRLSVWCNLDAFMRIDRIVRKELKGKDPRLAIYVDDIGITAAGVTKEDMIRLYPKIKAALEADKNHILPLNDKKTQIIYHSGETFDITGVYKGKFCFEQLGTQMNRNSVTPGTKSRWKLVTTTEKLKESKNKDKVLRRKRKSMLSYRSYMRRKA